MCTALLSIWVAWTLLDFERLLLLSHFKSCLTLCDPIDGSQPGSPVPGILQARTLEWVAISFSNAWKWKVKGKALSRVWLFMTPWTAAYQAPPSMGFSRQEYWSGLPLPSPFEWLIGVKRFEAQICLSSTKWSRFLYFSTLVVFRKLIDCQFPKVQAICFPNAVDLRITFPQEALLIPCRGGWHFRE